MIPSARLENKEYSGFTLVELVLTMLISAIISMAIYAQYRVQQQTYFVQDQVAEIQQNVRAAMQEMVTSIREAGCDPTELAGAGVVAASSSQFNFTADIAGSGLSANDGDGDLEDSNEDITFGFSTATADADGNGIADGGTDGSGVDWSASGSLGKDVGGGFQSIAENFDAIEFNYILADGTTTTDPDPSQLGLIRSVQVSLLGRASLADRKYVNQATFTTAAGTVWTPPADGFRRRLSVVNIQCRNLGM